MSCTALGSSMPSRSRTPGDADLRFDERQQLFFAGEAKFQQRFAELVAVLGLMAERRIRVLPRRSGRHSAAVGPSGPRDGVARRTGCRWGRLRAEWSAPCRRLDLLFDHRDEAHCTKLLTAAFSSAKTSKCWPTPVTRKMSWLSGVSDAKLDRAAAFLHQRRACRATIPARHCPRAARRAG